MTELRRDAADIRWHAAGMHGTPPGLIPLLTSLLGLYGTYLAVTSAARPAPPPPAPLPPPFFPTAPRAPAPMTRSVGGGLVLRGGLIAAAWIVRIFRRYGVVIAQAVWDAYQQYRIEGNSEADSRHRARRAHGVTDVGGRRRMNPTNVKALRRAVRRVRGFQRVTRKVDRLLPRGGRAVHRGIKHYAGHRRRGDADFYSEDRADAYDEAEDFGYEPGDLFAVEAE